MAKPGSPIQQAWALNILVLFMLTLFMPLPIYALWEQYVSQPTWQREGVRTIAKIVDMREQVIQKGHQMQVWVEHRPRGSGPTYRNWINGGYVTRLTGTSANNVRNSLTIGDKVEITYIPGDREGEAILPQALLPAARAPFETPLFAGIMFGLWGGFLAMAFILRMVSRKPAQLPA